MRRGVQTAFAVVAGVLVVMSAFAGPIGSPVGQASAEPLVDGCMVGPVFVVDVTGNLCNDAETDELMQADANETKQAIYDEASVQKQNNDVLVTSYQNYLEDTESIALMEGKNAYIRALENGTSEPVARNRATQAVADYYSQKQLNLIAAWNTTATVTNSSIKKAQNTSGVGDEYVWPTFTGTAAGGGGYGPYEGLDVDTVQLANATSQPILGPSFMRHIKIEDAVWYDAVMSFNFVTRTQKLDDAATYDQNITLHNFTVEPPNSNFETLSFAKTKELHNSWDEAESQNNQVQAQLDTFINNTYESYQKGEINASDLVDPYLGARDYAPANGSDYQTWALRSLTAMGISPPENLSNIGRMNVTAGGVTYEGILMSDETPSGGFTVGSTYNASNLTGHQFVALDNGRSKELTGEFTLESATTADGQEVATNETVAYNNITYETTSTEEFQELQSELDTLSAQINARQQRLRNTGGGGGFLPGFEIGLGGGFGVPVMLLVAGGVAVLVLGRN